MTNRPRLLRRTSPVPVLLALLVLLGPAHAADLPEGIVAIVGKENPRRLTFQGFSVAVAQQALAAVRKSMSGPRNVLEQLIEEKLVQQEATRLGVEVTQAEVTRTWKEWNDKVRRASNGERNLRDIIREKGTTEREFVESLWHQLRRKLVAQHPQYLGNTLPADENTQIQQIGIVIGRIREKTDVKYGILLKDHIDARKKPLKLAPGIVATVNGEPITMPQWGYALVMRLPGHLVRDYLDKECKTALMGMEGIRISEQDLDAEIEGLAELWTLERELLRDEVWRTVTFKDRFGVNMGVGVDDVKSSRYHRGLLGLVRSRRAEITEEQVAEAYASEKDGRYGSHILVTDIQIKFAQKKGFTAETGLRSRRQALEIAQTILRKQARGIPFEKITADINRARNPTVRSQRIRLYKTDQDRILYNHAARMRDGNISSPFETLSEVHVLRREGIRPARPLSEVRPYVREMLARAAARTWLEERVKDTQYVRISWPLKERGAALK